MSGCLAANEHFHAQSTGLSGLQAPSDLASSRFGGHYNPTTNETHFYIPVGKGAASVEVVFFRPKNALSFSNAEQQATGHFTYPKAPHSIQDFNETGAIFLTNMGNGTWQGIAPGIGPGDMYAYRVTKDPTVAQHEFIDAGTLLADPFSRAGAIQLRDWDYKSYKQGGIKPVALSAIVFEPGSAHGEGAQAFENRYGARWNGVNPVTTTPHNSIIYQINVGGFSAKNRSIPESLRGTLTGLAHKNSISRLKDLGVTHVQLQPISLTLSEPRVREYGHQNEWGYNPVQGVIAVDPALSLHADPQRRDNEFKYAVRQLQKNGIGVIVDLVFPHTAEGATKGVHKAPTTSMRGLNTAFYETRDIHGEIQFIDNTDCGNTVNFHNPISREWVKSQICILVKDYHVDGIRLDQAALFGLDFLEEIRRMPEMQGNKLLIAEPLAPGRNISGVTPEGVAEMDFQHRIDVRNYWAGYDRGRDSNQTVHAQHATAICGNEDRYGEPTEKITFLATHDGWALIDAFRYRHGDNQENGGPANYGSAEIIGDLCEEGWPDEMPVCDRQQQQWRNWQLEWALSQGVLKILGGDEYQRTKRGNTNGFTSAQLQHVHWNLSGEHKSAYEFTRDALNLRRENPGLFREWFGMQRDFLWFRTDGREMQATDWNTPVKGGLSFGQIMPVKTMPDGGLAEGTDLFIARNPRADHVKFRLPVIAGKQWKSVACTAWSAHAFSPTRQFSVPPGGTFTAPYKSLTVFKLVDRTVP